MGRVDRILSGDWCSFLCGVWLCCVVTEDITGRRSLSGRHLWPVRSPHSQISLLHKWVLEEIDKRRRGFLWTGKEKALGAHCTVAWPTVCRPTDYGGLGLLDLKMASFALRLRWLWLKKTDANWPWKNLQLEFAWDTVLQHMFQTSIQIQLRDGNLALFWQDAWLGQSSPSILAPDLCNLIAPQVKRTRTVAQALHQKQWILDFAGCATVPALTQYVLLWHKLANVHLIQGVEDRVLWRWDASGVYSARSAYRAFFCGATKFAAAKLIWKSWAPMKVKFFIWLAVKERLWTADRRHRHGLQRNAECTFCEQELETTVHLLAACPYTKEVWHIVSTVLHIQNTTSLSETSLTDYWVHKRRAMSRSLRKGMDSLFMLISWIIWKQRNDRNFDRAPKRNPLQLTELIREQAADWCAAGAKHLAMFQWPRQQQDDAEATVP